MYRGEDALLLLLTDIRIVEHRGGLLAKQLVQRLIAGEDPADLGALRHPARGFARGGFVQRFVERPPAAVRRFDFVSVARSSD